MELNKEKLEIIECDGGGEGGWVEKKTVLLGGREQGEEGQHSTPIFTTYFLYDNS